MSDENLDPPDKAWGLKKTSHGIVYQLKLLMLFFNRGFNEKDFKLFTELMTAEKFDDLVFQYEKDNKKCCCFLQAKHFQDNNKKITDSNFWAKTGKFNLQKYFMSYRNIRENKDFEGMEKEFVICTNIDIEESLKSSFQEVDNKSNILKFNNEKSRLLKLQTSKFPGYNNLLRNLKNCSKVKLFTTELARYAIEESNLTFKSIFKSNLSILREIVEVYEEEINCDGGKKKYVKFKTDFLEKNTIIKLSSYKEAFYEAAKEKLRIDSDDKVLELMKVKKLSISDNFANTLKKNPGTEPSINDLVVDSNLDKDIEGFFQDLVFAVNQPNEVELDKIIATEISEGKDIFNMIITELIASEFQKYVLNWMKQKKNTCLTQKEREDFFNEVKGKLCKFLLIGPSLAFNVIIEKFNIAFNEELIELQNFLRTAEKQIFNLVNPHKPALSSIKVVSTLNSTEEYKKVDSYILIPINTLLHMKDYVINAFTESPLLVIECEGNEEDIDDLFIKLSTVVEKSANKKIILITQRDNYLANKFKEKFDPDKYEEKDDEVNKLNNLTSKSQEKLLSEGRVIFQGQEVSLKDLIDSEEAKELIDGEILFQLMKKEKIEVGIKRPGLHDLESIYYITSVSIDKQQLSGAFEKNENDLFVFTGINKDELSQMIPKEDFKVGERICLFREDDLIREHKYVILSEEEDEEKFIEDFKQVCGYYSLLKTDSEQFSAHLIRKRDDNTLTWIRSYNPSLYINRKFYPNVINIGSLREIINKNYTADEKQEKRDIFAISNIKDNEFTKYAIKVSNTFPADKESIKANHICILNGENEEDSFQNFCDQRDLKRYYNIHWLQNKNTFFNNYLIWRRSKGAIDKINELQETKSSFYFNENDLRTEKAVVLAGDAGIGKSTTLTHLLGQPNEFEWVIKLDLVKFDKQLSTSNNTKDIDGFIESFFSKINIGMEGKFAKSLFKHKIEYQGKITFLFDGFDEITAKSQETVIKLLKLLKDSKANFRIATRLHDEGKLGKCLSMPSYKFSPFTREDRQNFFDNFEQIGLKFSHESNDNILKSAKALYKKIMDAEWEVNRIPLMTRMFADVCQEVIEKSYNCNNPEEFEDIKNFSMSYIYERFIRRNYDIYFKEKAKVDNMSDYMKDKLTFVFNKDHQHLALRKLFPDHAKVLTDKYEQLSAKEKNYFTSIGIVKADSSNTELYFTHQTFAEYFAAQFLVQIIKKRKDHPTYKGIYKFFLIEIFKNKCKLIREFIDEITKKENLISKWKEIQDSTLVKTNEQQEIISISDEASDFSLSDLQKLVDNRCDGNLKAFAVAIEGFVQSFIQKTDIEQLKTDLSSFLDLTKRENVVSSLKEVYLMDRVSSAVMHYFNQSKQSDLPVEEEFLKACIERVIGGVFSNFSEVLKNFEESGTVDNLQQIIDFFITSKGKKKVELMEWIKLNNLYYFLQIFHPDVINSIKSYIDEEMSILICYENAKKVLNSLIKTKFSPDYMINKFGTPWSLRSLQSLFLHIINYPIIIAHIESMINEIFKNKGKKWLENEGIFIYMFLQILTDKMSERLTSVLSKGTKRTIAYSRCLLQFLIYPIVDTLKKKEELPNIDMVALMNTLEIFFSFSVKYDDSILLTHEQLQSMLQFVDNILNEKHQDDKVLSMISRYMISLGKGGLKIVDIEKKLIVFDCLYKFQYDFLSSHADLIIEKIRNRTELVKTPLGKYFTIVGSSALGQKRKSSETILTESKQPRVEPQIITLS